MRVTLFDKLLDAISRGLEKCICLVKKQMAFLEKAIANLEDTDE